MSASRERRKRQEFYANGGVDPKAAREAEQKKAERRSNIFYAALGIGFVVIAVFLVVYNSGVFKRSATAVTIGGDKYSAADLSYYYYAAYNDLYQQTYGYPSMVGLDTSKSFSSQESMYSTEEEPQTWDEYFKETAVEKMRLVSAALAAAKEEGYTLTEEDQETIADAIASMKEVATSNGMSYKTFLTNVYGSLMTTGCYEKNLEDEVLASSYIQSHSDSLTYTADQVQAVYDEDPNSYDNVEYMLVNINGAAESTEDEEGNTVEPTEEESEAAWNEAKTTAQHILDEYDAGGELETIAEDFENATYSYSEAASYSSSSEYLTWCFEEGRQAGDSTIIEDEDSSRVYVVVFLDRFLDESATVDVRHILITSDSVETAESEDGEETEVPDEEIKAKAEEILAMWDGTEEGFAELAKEYSQDNASAGGLYEGVAPGDMVEEFDAWCFDSSRQTGDTGIVKSDYGYHIMYFVKGGGQPQWYLNAEATLRDEDMTAWQEELVEPYTAETNAKAMSYVTR